MLTEAQAERLYGDVFRDWLQEQLKRPPEGVRRALRGADRIRRRRRRGPIDRLRARRLDAGRLARLPRAVAARAVRSVARDRRADRRAARRSRTISPTTPSSQRDSLLRRHRSAPASRAGEIDAARSGRGRATTTAGSAARRSRAAIGDFRRSRARAAVRHYSKGCRAHRRVVGARAPGGAPRSVSAGRRRGPRRAAAAELREPSSATRRQGAAGALDFLDLLIRARDLVRDHDEVRPRFQQRFTHIFVDEFQDTDPLQAEIAAAARRRRSVASATGARPSAPGKLFIVGDPKQSIYRFRRADVGMYQRGCASSSTRTARSACTLTTSFRSCRRSSGP